MKSILWAVRVFIERDTESDDQEGLVTRLKHEEYSCIYNTLMVLLPQCCKIEDMQALSDYALTLAMLFLDFEPAQEALGANR